MKQTIFAFILFFIPMCQGAANEAQELGLQSTHYDSNRQSLKVKYVKNIGQIEKQTVTVSQKENTIKAKLSYYYTIINGCCIQEVSCSNANSGTKDLQSGSTQFEILQFKEDNQHEKYNLFKQQITYAIRLFEEKNNALLLKPAKR